MTDRGARLLGPSGQAQLSRALAGRGYEVTHQHCPSYATGKGSLELEPGDPPTLTFEACAWRVPSPSTRSSPASARSSPTAAGPPGHRGQDPAWRSSATCRSWPTRAGPSAGQAGRPHGVLAPGHLLRGHRRRGAAAPALSGRGWPGWRSAWSADRPAQRGCRGHLATFLSGSRPGAWRQDDRRAQLGADRRAPGVRRRQRHGSGAHAGLGGAGGPLLGYAWASSTTRASWR